MHSLFTSDLGKTWTQPVEHTGTLGHHPAVNGIEKGICDFTPKWHAKSGVLLGTGHTVHYENNHLVTGSPRATVWSVYEPKTQTWTPWQALKMPDEPKFACSGAGSTQRVDLENGDVLLPTWRRSIPIWGPFWRLIRPAFSGMVPLLLP